MVFGQTYSLNYVKPLLWVHTGPCKKFVRTVLGLALSGGIYFLCTYWVHSNDHATKYFFKYLLPALLMSFFNYGLFPIFCNRVGLIISREEFEAIAQPKQNKLMQS
jgi:hypothetical protein